MFSVMFRFPLPPGRLAWYQQAGRGGSGSAETESTLALAENVYVNLPRPYYSLSNAKSDSRVNEPYTMS
jgi:hypothetical protein